MGASVAVYSRYSRLIPAGSATIATQVLPIKSPNWPCGDTEGASLHSQPLGATCLSQSTDSVIFN